MRNGADNWWQYAIVDLKSARLLLAEGIYTQACFHAQQAVEKALKAVIAARGETPPRTHKISLLVEITSLPLEDLANELNDLDLVYLPTRYPDALPGTLPEGEPSRELAAECVDLAGEVVDRIAKYLRERAGLSASEDSPEGG